MHTGQALSESGKLRVLPRQTVLDTLAIGDRTPFGDYEGDAPIACSQRADREVKRAGFAAGDAHADIEAPETTLGRGGDRSVDHIYVRLGRPRPPRRGPQRKTDDLREIDAPCDEGSRVHIENVSGRVEQRGEVRGLGKYDLRHELARDGVFLRVGHGLNACS